MQTECKSHYRLQVVLTKAQREALRRLVYVERKSLKQLFADLLGWKTERYPEVTKTMASEPPDNTSTQVLSEGFMGCVLIRPEVGIEHPRSQPRASFWEGGGENSPAASRLHTSSTVLLCRLSISNRVN